MTAAPRVIRAETVITEREGPELRQGPNGRDGLLPGRYWRDTSAATASHAMAGLRAIIEAASTSVVTMPEGLPWANSVPVLLITGPVGVGQSTVAAEAARLLREAKIPHALVDLAWIEQCWLAPADDPWNERLTPRNLACLWVNFRQAGADRLILVRVLEARSLLRHVAEAVPGAEIRVVRLRAPLAVLHTRIRSREASDPSWFLGAATHTAKVMEQAQVEDHLVDNQDRPVAVVAGEVLRLAGWLGSGAGA